MRPRHCGIPAAGLGTTARAEGAHHRFSLGEARSGNACCVLRIDEHCGFSPGPAASCTEERSHESCLVGDRPCCNWAGQRARPCGCIVRRRRAQGRRARTGSGGVRRTAQARPPPHGSRPRWPRTTTVARAATRPRTTGPASPSAARCATPSACGTTSTPPPAAPCAVAYTARRAGRLARNRPRPIAAAGSATGGRRRPPRPAWSRPLNRMG